MRTPGTMSPVPGMRGLHPGVAAAPRLAQQQLYFGQVSPAGLIPQATGYGYGYQQQHLPGVMPGHVPSNFVMPLQYQHPQRPQQRGCSRRGPNSYQHQQQVSSMLSLYVIIFPFFRK